MDTRFWIPDAGYWMLDTSSWMLALSVEGDGDFVITIPMALPSGEVILILKKIASASAKS
jgi:hypothetical protein